LQQGLARSVSSADWRGLLSGEGALVRAVYWRVHNLAALPANNTENYSSPQTVSDYRMGVGRLLEINGHPNFDCSQFIDELLHRYEHESDRLGGMKYESHTKSLLPSPLL
jgi:hypothetical protein